MPAHPLSEAAETLRALHASFLVLPNAWDAASAKAVGRAGFPAVATSSFAVAQALGYPDDDSVPPAEAFAAIAVVARVARVPVTADLTAGYGLDPGELVERLLHAGAVGCNLEDSDHAAGSGLVAADAHAGRVAAVKEAGRAAGVDVVVNARTDVFMSSPEVTEEALGEAIARARVYRDAGADCVFVPFVEDEEAIARLVGGIGGPVNVMVGPSSPPLSRLAELGVRRASYGGYVYARALQAVGTFVEEIRAAVPA